MPEPIPAEAAPLTCEYCCNTEASQVFSADVFKRRLRGEVWRFNISPIKETADA